MRPAREYSLTVELVQGRLQRVPDTSISVLPAILSLALSGIDGVSMAVEVADFRDGDAVSLAVNGQVQSGVVFWAGEVGLSSVIILSIATRSQV